MFAKFKRCMPVLTALALLPTALEAQEPQAAPPPLPEEAQAVLQEMQQVQANLNQIQQQALSDPELQAEQAALGEQIQVAMAEANPQVPQQIQRLESLLGEARQAQEAEDAARMQEIVSEARELETSLQAAQAQAVQRPEIAPRIQSFQEKLEEKMLEVDASTPQLVQRLEELQAELLPFVSGQQ